MKLRILDSAIRLRLDRGEVERIGRGEAVSGATEFAAGNRFTYRLMSADAGDATARFEDGVLTVRLPASRIEAWSDSDGEVSIRAVDGPTTLLVEKDFECLDPRDGEDQSNRFRNPGASRP